MSFVRHAILSLLCLIDEAIYSIASMIYSLLMYIAESNIFTQETIQSFATRIYVLIGVFMLFKVAFSLINYIVNPDDFTKGERGVNKLVSNVMISLVLIVFTPRIFAEAMELQKLITSQHFFEKIILSTGYNEAIENDPGDNMAISLFSAFFYYVDEAPTSDNYYTQLDGTTYFAYNSMYAAFDSDSEYNAYEGIWDDKATYKPIISTAAGIVLVLVLIQFCFDIAIRAVKLGFLELMAPIPIISRMDPKSSKNGIFSKWVNECIDTYIDLFVRLIALFFAIYVINLILETPFAVDPDANGITQMLVRAMLMLGALLFARQLPTFIGRLFGEKNRFNGFTLNPMRRMREVPGFNRVTGGLGGAYQRAVGRMEQENRFGTNRGRAILRALGSGVAGAGAGVLANRGFRGQMTAARQTQHDLQKAATQLRMLNPNLTEQQAMERARREMNQDRRRERLGLETNAERYERLSDEIKIQKHSAELEKERLYKQQQKDLEHQKEEIESRQRAIKENQKNLTDQKNTINDQKNTLMDEEKAIANATRNKNNEMSQINTVEDSRKQVWNAAKDYMHDSSKTTLVGEQYKEKEAEIKALQSKQEQFERTYDDKQLALKNGIAEISKLTSDKNKLDLDINNLQTQLSTGTANGTLTQEQIENMNNLITTKQQQSKETTERLNQLRKDVKDIQDSGVEVDKEIKDTTFYKKISSDIEKKKTEKDDWEKKTGINALIDVNGLLEQKNQVYADLSNGKIDAAAAQTKIDAINNAIDNSYYSKERTRYESELNQAKSNIRTYSDEIEQIRSKGLNATDMKTLTDSKDGINSIITVKLSDEDKNTMNSKLSEMTKIMNDKNLTEAQKREKIIECTKQVEQISQKISNSADQTDIQSRVKAINDTMNDSSIDSTTKITEIINNTKEIEKVTQNNSLSDSEKTQISNLEKTIEQVLNNNSSNLSQTDIDKIASLNSQIRENEFAQSTAERFISQIQTEMSKVEKSVGNAVSNFIVTDETQNDGKVLSDNGGVMTSDGFYQLKQDNEDAIQKLKQEIQKMIELGIDENGNRIAGVNHTKAEREKAIADLDEQIRQLEIQSRAFELQMRGISDELEQNAEATRVLNSNIKEFEENVEKANDKNSKNVDIASQAASALNKLSETNRNEHQGQGNGHGGGHH